MKERFWLFGATSTVASVRDRLSRALSIETTLHESDYRGGEYVLGRSASLREVIIQRNFRDDDGYFAEADYPEISVLVYVTQGAADPPIPPLDELGLALLRVEEV